MQGLSERQYAERVGLSRVAILKAKAAGRLVLFPDGSIDPAASDAKRSGTTDPSKQRSPAKAAPMKPVPDAAVAAVGDTLRESGLATPSTSSGTTFLQAKTANEVLKAQERRLKLQKMKSELVDRARATALVFRLAREAICHRGHIGACIPITITPRYQASPSQLLILTHVRGNSPSPFHTRLTFLQGITHGGRNVVSKEVHVLAGSE